MTGKTLPGLPAPFENAYFRERALKVAARQKQGHILVSGTQPDSGQGFPLPYIQDVPGLKRGSYPYDYECEWGRFKYEYELSAYLFTPHNGQVPPGWERYDLHTPIQPVTAVIDRARRLATVKTPGSRDRPARRSGRRKPLQPAPAGQRCPGAKLPAFRGLAAGVGQRRA